MNANDAVSKDNVVIDVKDSARSEMDRFKNNFLRKDNSLIHHNKQAQTKGILIDPLNYKHKSKFRVVFVRMFLFSLIFIGWITRV